MDLLVGAKIVQEKKVAILGAGGIGSNIAVHLVRSSFFNFTVIDYDIVDESNLNRQFYFHEQIGANKCETLKKNLIAISPKAKDIEIINKRITRENLLETIEGCSIIAEGFDEAEEKAMIVEMLAGSEKCVVVSNGIAGIDSAKIKKEKHFGNIWIVGDMETDILCKKLYSPKIFMVASVMSEIVLNELGFDDKRIM